MDEKIKELINGWGDETSDEREDDIEKFLRRIMDENADDMNDKCERKVKSMIISAEVSIDEIKKVTPKTVDKFKFNKPIKGKLRKIIRKIRKKDKKKRYRLKPKH